MKSFWLFAVLALMVGCVAGLFGRGNWQGSNPMPNFSPVYNTPGRPLTAPLPTQTTPAPNTNDAPVSLPPTPVGPLPPVATSFGVYLYDPESKYSCQLQTREPKGYLVIQTGMPQVPKEAQSHLRIIIWQPQLVGTSDVQLYWLNGTPLVRMDNNINGRDISHTCSWGNEPLPNTMPPQSVLIISRPSDKQRRYHQRCVYCVILRSVPGAGYYPFHFTGEHEEGLEDPLP